MRHFCTSSRSNINLKETLIYLAQQLSGDCTLHIIEPEYLAQVEQRRMAVARAVAEAAATPLPESDDEDDISEIHKAAAIPLPESETRMTFHCES